jgi:hypothetical protein
MEKRLYADDSDGSPSNRIVGAGHRSGDIVPLFSLSFSAGAALASAAQALARNANPQVAERRPIPPSLFEPLLQ